MKYLCFILFFNATLLVTNSFASTPKFTAKNVPKNMSVAVQKERFYYLVVPAVKRVHTELTALHNIVEKDLESGANMVRIEKLKSIYRVKSDRALLLALKPHPQSIALAQAAMESAWATSRFFIEAKNLFGVWSTNKDQARIAADEKRNTTKTIWLRKFESIEDSVREYYRMMGRGRAYQGFREVRYETDDVHAIVKELHRYSEIGEKYAEELSSMIEYNKLTKYDKQ